VTFEIALTLKMETVFLSKRRYLPKIPHGFKSQKTNFK
jgi:hypothetical protein